MEPKYAIITMPSGHAVPTTVLEVVGNQMNTSFGHCTLRDGVWSLDTAPSATVELVDESAYRTATRECEQLCAEQRRRRGSA